MKIAILSDTHDNQINFQKALDQVIEQGAEVLLFCGDFCSPGIAIRMATFPGIIHSVFGNNDGDRINLQEKLSQNPKATIHKEYADIVIDGKKIGLTHYPFYADKMAKSGDFDLVCFGHDHQARVETYGSCLAVNPGSLNQQRTDDKMGYAVYDTTTHQAELFSVT